MYLFVIYDHRQIDRDCELLEQEGIMDYSLLVGIHFKDISPEGDLIPSGSHSPPAGI
jgi:1-phosphatidylinositol-4-phosphate 5-kinase